nr:hypothetical protein CFP56_65035 [Quercus suber]
MDEFFTLQVHYGGHFTWDPQKYVGGTVDQIENYDPNLVKGFEEIHVFFKHLVDEPLELLVEDFKPLDVRQHGKEPKGVDAQALEFRGHDNEVDAEHVYAWRPGKEPVAKDQQQDPVDEQTKESNKTEGSDLEDEPEMQPMNIGEEIDRLWFKMLGVNPEHANFHQVVDDDAVVFMTDLVKGFEEIHVFSKHLVDEPLELLVEDFKPLDVRQHGKEPEGVDAQALEFRGHDNEVDAEHVYAWRPGKEPVAKDQQQDPVDEQTKESNKTEGSDLEDEPEMQPMNIGEESTDSWDNEVDEAEVEPGQMDDGVMNFDYEIEELLSLDESSSDSDHSNASSDDDNPAAEVDNSIRSSRFPIFKPVANAEHIRFEKDMLFISPKQFKEAITDYAVHGGWGIRFVKNDSKGKSQMLAMVQVCCLPCKGVKGEELQFENTQHGTHMHQES